MTFIKTVKMIDCHEFSKFVAKTYGRPYNLQQQDGCKSRGTVSVYVPSECYDYPNDTVPEIVNHSDMGVSFGAWLARDPKQKLPDQSSSASLETWWERNFYPDLDMILNDLHSNGLIDAGEYTVDIDW